MKAPRVETPALGCAADSDLAFENESGVNHPIADVSRGLDSLAREAKGDFKLEELALQIGDQLLWAKLSS